MTISGDLLAAIEARYPLDDVPRLAAMPMDELRHCYDAARIIYDNATEPVHWRGRSDREQVMLALLNMRERFRRDGVG